MLSMTETKNNFTELADLGRTLGNAHRMMLLEHIAQDEKSVEQLARRTGLSVANTSQHLQHLKRAGLVRTNRQGKHIFYSLASGPVLELLEAMQAFVDHGHREIEKLLTQSRQSPETMEALSREELMERMAENSVILLDVREGEDYVAGHLPGALHIPYEELEARLAELPKDKEIVAYCRGPNCLLSADAAALLIKQGWKASRLAKGFPDWKQAQLPVEAGPVLG